MKQDSLPSGAEFYPAASPSGSTVLFVPFFGGVRGQLKRHIDFVNGLGFDAVAFDLRFDRTSLLRYSPWSRKSHRFGLKYIWADKIEAVLQAVKGPKIVFAMSNPSSAALIAIERYHATVTNEKVLGLIVDGGPFEQVLSCNWNYMKYEAKLPLPLRFPSALFTALMWGPDHNQSLRQSLASLPKNFPVLSIRGWNDPLVPPRAIEAAFENHKNLALEVLSLPEGGHLNGLKDFPNEYKPRVQKFLSRWMMPTTF